MFVLFITEYCNNNIKRIYGGVRYFTFIKKSYSRCFEFTADGGKYLLYYKVALLECHDCYLVNQCMSQVVISISCGWQSSSETANNPNTQPVLALKANKLFLFWRNKIFLVNSLTSPFTP